MSEIARQTTAGKVLSMVGKGIKYAKLIAAEGGDGPCPA